MTENKKKWVVNEIELQKAEKIVEETGMSRLLAMILAGRGFSDIDHIRNFLKPNLSNLHSPYLLKDMQKSVEKIIQVIDSKGKIIIYGDFDVDGVTSTSLLYDFLKKCGAEVEYFIPDRLEEGYGLNINSIELLIKDKPALIITVDCGISANKEVDYLKKNGIDIIITDHHECPDVLPDGFSIINPKQHDCTYPFKFLAGVGVAFKLVQAIAQKLSWSDKDVFQYLDLVCLGTVADIVPLVDENRILVKYGVLAVEKTRNEGVRVLCDESGIKEFNSWNISFMLAPRINAAGRIGSASTAVELLTCRNVSRAKELAKELNLLNRKRQEIEIALTEDVIKLIDEKNLNTDSILVIYGNRWHHGVIGIVASRIAEKYNKPCILISFDDDVGRGSGRSSDSINLFEILQSNEHLLMKYGGHEKACGLTISLENIEEFSESIKNIVDEKLKDKKTERIINADITTDFANLDFKSVEQLKFLQPFGMENQAPLIVLNKVKIENLKAVGDNKHLKLLFSDNGKKIDGIGFRMGEYKTSLKAGSLVDIVCSPEINNFNGKSSVQLNVKDIRTVSN